MKLRKCRNSQEVLHCPLCVLKVSSGRLFLAFPDTPRGGWTNSPSQASGHQLEEPGSGRQQGEDTWPRRISRPTGGDRPAVCVCRGAG